MMNLQSALSYVMWYLSWTEYVDYCLGVIPHSSISREIPNKVGKVAPFITVDLHHFYCSSDVLQQMRVAKVIDHSLTVKQDPCLWNLTIGLVKTKH